MYMTLYKYYVIFSEILHNANINDII